MTVVIGLGIIVGLTLVLPVAWANYVERPTRPLRYEEYPDPDEVVRINQENPEAQA